MSRVRTFTTPGIVLKRSNVGEADRVVTLFTPDQGKLVCIAKGSRKLSSSLRATLEPGNVLTAFLVTTQSLPILTQAKMVADTQDCRSQLSKMRQLTQLLEMIDRLSVEEQGDEHIYQLFKEARDLIVQPQATSGRVKDLLSQVLVELGYQDPADTQYQHLLEYVSALSDRPLKTWEYLQVKST